MGKKKGKKKGEEKALELGGGGGCNSVNPAMGPSDALCPMTFENMNIIHG